MRDAESPTALRVQELLGNEFRVVEFEESTRTSADAAAAIGCSVAQIAKSLVFRTEGGGSVLVVASGANRVDEGKVATSIGDGIGRASPTFVREVTGYAVGGVAPVGPASHVAVLLDEDLRSFETLWAAGGTPNAVFELTPADLAGMTSGRFEDVAQR